MYLQNELRCHWYFVAQHLATGWTVQGSSTHKDGEAIFIFSTVHTGSGESYNEYRGSFPGYSGRGGKLTAHLHLVLRLRMSGNIPLFPHMSLLSVKKTSPSPHT